MPGIICAVRGGPDSQPTIVKAIALAKEESLPVVLHVGGQATPEQEQNLPVSMIPGYAGPTDLDRVFDDCGGQGVQRELFCRIETLVTCGHRAGQLP